MDTAQALTVQDSASAIESSLGSVAGKSSVMQRAHNRLPLNQHGLPAIIYRPDFLPTNDPDIEIDDHQWDAATIEVNYAEGYPTLEYGIPLWERLDFEPVDSYVLFQKYLNQVKDGIAIRSLHVLAKNLSEDPKDVSQTLVELNELFYLYYWPQRVKAFDLFECVVLGKLREHRAITIEDVHYDTATQLMKIAKEYIFGDDGKGEDSEFIDLMTPKSAMEALKYAATMQRISSGLPAAGPRLEGGGQNVEVSVKQGIRTTEETDTPAHMRDEILGDVETTEMAQQLIIKINGGQNG